MAPGDIDASDNGSFHFRVAQGRSAAWTQLGNLDRAIAFEEEAVRLQPNAAPLWNQLSQMYRLQGRGAEAERASERAAKVAASEAHP